MKKLFLMIIVFVLWCNVGFADEKHVIWTAYSKLVYKTGEPVIFNFGQVSHKGVKSGGVSDVSNQQRYFKTAYNDAIRLCKNGYWRNHDSYRDETICKVTTIKYSERNNRDTEQRLTILNGISIDSVKVGWDGMEDDLVVIKKKPKEKEPKQTPDGEKIVVASSGSAFFIDNKGHLITNFHVVEECYDQSKIIYKTDEYDTKLIAKDKFLDLALLKANVQNNKFIVISSKPPKKLKKIIVAGYPFGKDLSDDLKFNSGIITSLKGLGDDSTRIQIDAAVNPGNSGGPIVYEENGLLAAVAVAGLRKDVTESVNFGIKGSSLINFLEANQINVATISMQFSFDDEDLAELLEATTVYTFCN